MLRSGACHYRKFGFVSQSNVQPKKYRGDAAPSLGVVLDKFNSTPPRLYGQTEYILQSDNDIPRVFAAVASRNTAATSLNDTSSRSHCFITLTLWEYTRSTATIRRNRFQFCDLAGSERINDAFVNGMTTNNTNQWQGVMTNWSLLELSRCLQDIAMTRERNQKFSMRAYQTELPLLLSGALVGTASTTCICCVSKTHSNWSQTKNTVSFGQRFAALAKYRDPVVVREEAVLKLQQHCCKTIKENQTALQQNTKTNANAKFRIIRQAKVRDSEVVLDLIDKLQSMLSK